MPLSQNEVMRVTAKMSYDIAGDLQNVYYYRQTAPVTVPDSALLVSVPLALDTIYTNINTVMSTQMNYDTIELFNVTTSTPIGETVWPTLTVGLETASILAPQLAAQVNFTTDEAKTQGRKFIGGITEAGNDAFGGVDPAVVAALALYIADLLVPIPVGAGSVEVGHVKVLTGVFVKWLAGIIPTIWATQRRRKVNVGS